MQNYELCLIIPLKLSNIKLLQNLGIFYSQLAADCDEQAFSVQIIIADSSDNNIHNILAQQITHSNVLHIIPKQQYHTGKNNKLNNIHAALAQAQSEYIVLLDDDMRPSLIALKAIRNNFNQYDFFRCMVCFCNPNFYDLIDLAGIYFVNVISKYKQFWGNLCFKKSLLNSYNFPNKDMLFDDFGLELHCRKQSINNCYQINPPLPILGSLRTFKKFVEQRIRYAYENLAFPMRFVSFLLLIPLFFLGINFIPIATCSVFLCLNITLLSLTYYGQQLYGKQNNKHLTWCYILLWFWIYPISSWVALIYRLTGGIYFGGNKLKKNI